MSKSVDNNDSLINPLVSNNFKIQEREQETQNLDYRLSSYDYKLPPELIAQTPVTPRDHSRLLVVDSATSYIHTRFKHLPEWLRPGDLLVLNDTRVIPARLYGHKSTGAEVEILLLEEQSEHRWLALVKPGKRLPVGTQIKLQAQQTLREGQDISLQATVVARDETTGGRVLEFNIPEGMTFAQALDYFGVVPLPPYVTSTQSQPSQYQTVYARQPGAIAAPTAGLHFTEELLGRLKQQGVEQANVTLHVGVGTFRPVEAEEITTHQMHQEWLEVPAATVAQIERTKAAGGRVIAVGTTVVRALEGAVAKQGQLEPFRGKTDLFIYPGYHPQVVEGLITNFHLPRSSLLMLVSAFIGRERLLALYQEAIAQRYRFYSFGDAMLILPAATVYDSKCK